MQVGLQSRRSFNGNTPSAFLIILFASRSSYSAGARSLQFSGIEIAGRIPWPGSGLGSSERGLGGSRPGPRPSPRTRLPSSRREPAAPSSRASGLQPRASPARHFAFRNPGPPSRPGAPEPVSVRACGCRPSFAAGVAQPAGGRRGPTGFRHAKCGGCGRTAADRRRARRMLTPGSAGFQPTLESGDQCLLTF